MTLIDRPPASGASTEAGVDPTKAVPVADLFVPLGREQFAGDLDASGSTGDGQAAPPARRRRPNWRAWRGRLIVVLLLAGCVGIGIRQVAVHNRNIHRVSLNDVTLTADPIGVLADSNGVVQRVNVRPGQQVTSGDVLARVQLPLPGDARRGSKAGVESLTAPADGVVSDISVQTGSSVRNGDVVIRLYQPDQIYFRVQVDSSRLPSLRVGMSGPFRAGTIGPVTARLVRIEPVLNGDSSQSGTSRLVIQPVNEDSVRALVPGLVFSGWLDKSSVRGSAPSSSP